MKKICVVSSTRADYGIMRPLLEKLKDHKGIELAIAVTGMHLCSEFGYTYQEIEEDGFEIHKKIDIQMSSDTAAGMSKTMGIALICFSDYFQNTKPDFLIVLGDRFEIAAICCAAVNQCIPIAHLYGGEVTEGAVDECYRHVITKMSILHFTSCESYRKRVIQLGEAPENVFNVGSLSVENVLSIPLLSLQEFEKELSYPLQDKPYAVVTFHPVTKENNTGFWQARELMKAIDCFPEMRFIITKSNADAGAREINKFWDACCMERQNLFSIPSLGMQKYLTALKFAAFMIGNSSSGIIEGPITGIPVINIGDRQKGRLFPKYVLHCLPDHAEITNMIKIAMTMDLQTISKDTLKLYGDGHSSEKITDILTRYLKRSNGSTIKKFYDINYMVFDT